MKTTGNIKSIINDRLKTDQRELLYTKIREEAGTADKLDLLLQEEKLLASKIQTVNAKINEIISIINLYQALGGVDFIEITSENNNL